MRLPLTLAPPIVRRAAPLAALTRNRMHGLTDWCLARHLVRSVHPYRAGRTPSDLLLVQVREPAGQGLMLKYPLSGPARTTLARQQQVLTRLAADERLGGFSGLLPRTVVGDRDGAGRFVVEQRLPGVDAGTLLRWRPECWMTVATTALAAVARLHRATERQARVDLGHLHRWVDVPIEVIRRESAAMRRGGHAAALEAVRNSLYQGLYGCRTPVSFVHGDYHPGNVLLSEDARRVTGIVDWGSAHDGAPPHTDCCLFLLALRRAREDTEIGRLVADVVRRGGLSDVDRRLLSIGVGPPAVDEVTLALLTWLRHVADNMAKSRRFSRGRLWFAGNVLPVLRAVTT